MRNAQKGLTLVEVLISVSVILLLMGLLFPTYRQARFRGKVTGDLAQLRQVGLANALYEQEFETRNYSIPQLLRTGRIDPKIVESKNDVEPEGFMRFFIQSIPMDRDDPARFPDITQRVSFISLANGNKHFGNAFVKERGNIQIEEIPGSGWAYWLPERRKGSLYHLPVRGTREFLRLRFDTSVGQYTLRRRFMNVPEDEGGISGWGYSSADFYFDPE